MEVQGSYGRQLQGVSQQPIAVRLPGQVTSQLNAVPNVVDGLKTRMGSKHLARILDSLDPNSLIHHYKRGDDAEEYFVILRPGQVPVIFTVNGLPCSVNTQGSAATYLNSSSLPRETTQLMTIGDYTFVLNRTMPVRARGDMTPGLDNKGLVYVAYANFSFTYQILINGQVAAQHKTASSEDVKNEDLVRTDYVAGKLIEDWNTKKQNFPGFSMYQDGNVIVVDNNSGAAYSLTTIDGADGQDLVAIRHKVSNLDTLPNRAPAGYKVQVWPTGSKPESRYWLQAEPQDGSKVTWVETIAPGVRLGWDGATMPHVLVRESLNSDGSANFTYRPGEWEDRDVGDDLTNDFPSLLNVDSPQPISSMLMVQNRLMLTSGEAVVASRTSRFFDFFRYTVLATVDTDPFDVFADIEEVYNIRWSAQMDGDVILFTSDQQFTLPGDKPLTPTSAVIRPVTAFKMTPGVRPVPSGDSILFAFDQGSYSGIREFFTDSYSDTKKAQPATSHVDKYIRGKVLELSASSSFNRAFIITNSDRSVLYVYDWLYEGTEKVQNAWHKWSFPAGTVLHTVSYSNEKLYLVMSRNNTSGAVAGVYIEVMDMGDELEYGLQDRVRMDRRATSNMHYNAANRTWTSDPLKWLPTDLSSLDAVLLTGWPSYVGGAFQFSYNPSTNTISTNFDLAEGGTVQVVVGETYWYEVEPTPPLIKDSKDRVSYLDTPTVGNIYLNLDMYPDFSVVVTDKETLQERVVYLSNKIAGSLTNVIGYISPHEGTLRVPIRRKSTDISFKVRSKSPSTFQLRDIEWTGSYNPRKRRV
ncbi:tail tubular protein B [Erwinia phage VyarbaL]|nr:tail tubular protein B [Erwinia phage VyarbaL]